MVDGVIFFVARGWNMAQGDAQHLAEQAAEMVELVGRILDERAAAPSGTNNPPLYDLTSSNAPGSPR